MTADSASTVVACPACGTKNRVPRAGRGRVRCSKCKTALPWLVVADDASFGEAVVDSRMPVLVDVWAPWCGPCRAVSPVVEALSREFAGRIKVAKVNSDESPAISAGHRVTSIPTLLIYRDGKEVSRLIGARPAAELRSWVTSVLGPS